MQFSELKALAYNNNQVNVTSLPYHEKCVLVALNGIYDSYKKGIVSKESAKEKTDKLEADFNRFAEEYKFFSKNVKKASTLWKEIEIASQEYKKSTNHTPEADRMYEVIYGVSANG